MDVLKKHADTVVILTAFASAMLWMNGKFNDLEKDVATIKTVLIMQKIMPVELVYDQSDDPEGLGFIPEHKVRGK